VKNIVHIITGLNQGGAESVLYKICKETTEKFSHSVVSLTDKGFFSKQFDSLDIPVYAINFRNFFLLPVSVIRLYKLIKKQQPDIVQTWMYHADFFGGVAAKMAGVSSIIWNIRGPLNAKKTNFETHLLARLCAFISRWVPNKIVSCSEYAAKVHIGIGYMANKLMIIPNGYKIPDVNDFDIHPLSRQTQKLVVIGMIARFDPYKDHESLLMALKFVKQGGINFRCLLAGSEIEKNNSDLMNLIRSANLENNIELLGLQKNVNEVIEKLDIHILSSIDEAFPNVVAESMAMGVPNVSTNVGDAALIVGGLGWIVEPGKPKDLANAILEAIKEKEKSEWVVRKKKCRQRIVEHFSMEKMCNLYSNLWEKNKF
jgi:glycosyltransferase involved in cell wall biosynthesis